MNRSAVMRFAAWWAWPAVMVLLDVGVRWRVVRVFSVVEWTCYGASVVLLGAGWWLVVAAMRVLRLRCAWCYRVLLAVLALLCMALLGAGYGTYLANGDLPDLFLFSFIRCETENAVILFRAAFRVHQAALLVAVAAGLAWWTHRQCAAVAPATTRRGALVVVLLAWLALWYCWNGTATRGQCFVPVVRIPLVGAMYGYNEIKGINPKPIRLPAREPLEIAGPLPPPPCNVLVILNESLRRQNLGIYGHSRPTTPFMTEFAARHPDRFFKFERAYSNSTATLLSVPSILTGISPLQPLEARRRAPLLWQWARAAGLRSFHITSHDLAWCHIGQFITTPPPDRLWEQRDDELPHYRDLGCDDHFTVARAVEHLGSFGGTAPSFCGVVHLNTNHYPYNTREEYQRWHGRDVDLYDNTILETDTHTRALVTALEKGGLLENTAIIFTSDHGEGFSEHGHTAHFYCHYVETVSVPMWIYLPPAVLRGRDLTALRANLRETVQNLDLLPTLLDCLGAWDAPAAAPFRSPLLGSSLLRPLPADRTVWITNTDETLPGVIGLSSIKGSRHYLLRTSTTPPREDLYDLTTDPWEKHNLWPATPAAERDAIRRSFLRFPVAEKMMRAAVPGVGNPPPGGGG